VKNCAQPNQAGTDATSSPWWRERSGAWLEDARRVGDPPLVPAAACSQLGIWEGAVDEKVPWISTGLGLFPWAGAGEIFLKKYFLKKHPHRHNNDGLFLKKKLTITVPHPSLSLFKNQNVHFYPFKINVDFFV
jgi:hypothetical protein